MDVLRVISGALVETAHGGDLSEGADGGVGDAAELGDGGEAPVGGGFGGVEGEGLDLYLC